MGFNRFERARVIGARALQVGMGAPILLHDIPQNVQDPVRIAELEYDEGIIPTTVKLSGTRTVTA